MTTISVPLTSELEGMLNRLIGQGVANTRAEVMRKGLRELAREQALQGLLQAQREIAEGKGLIGDPRILMHQIGD
jgi:Arc/MetJ-type ribon-helix-helix transcriptional regulator